MYPMVVEVREGKLGQGIGRDKGGGGVVCGFG
jgi:hypothetical protein